MLLLLSVAPLGARGQAPSPIVDSGNDVRIGAWTLLVHHDRMNDHTMHIAMVQDRFNSLVVKCDNPGRNSVYVGFYTNRFLGDGDEPVRLFRWRVDQEKPVSGQWVYDHTYAHLVDPAQVAAFLKRIEAGHTLLVHAFSVVGDLVEGDFQLNGAEEAVSRLEAACR
jgi:hypothetical protein